MKDTNYYNVESSIYSSKRYPERTTDYLHYFFKKRLSIVLAFVKKNVTDKNGLKLLEIGCADGVITKRIEEKFGDKFSEIQGIDLSPQMIETAEKNKTLNSKIKYLVRTESNAIENSFDFIVEVGVINFTDFLAELQFVQKSLQREGLYILSIAGRDALVVRFGRNKVEAYKNLLNYSDYEKKIVEYFDIIEVIPYGFWLPGLWKLPALARMMQPVLDFIFTISLPNLFHEKIYLLKLKK